MFVFILFSTTCCCQSHLPLVVVVNPINLQLTNRGFFLSFSLLLLPKVSNHPSIQLITFFFSFFGDHLPIRFDYNKNLSSKNNHHHHRNDQQLITTVKWNTTNVDWNEWAKNIEQELILANIHDVNIIKNIEKEDNLDYVISQLNNILTKINNKMLPRYKVNILHQ